MRKVKLTGSGRIVEVTNQDAFAMTQSGEAELVQGTQVEQPKPVYNNRKMGAKNVTVGKRPYNTRKN